MTNITLSVPVASAQVGQALVKLVLDIHSVQKSGATGLALLTQEVSIAIGDLAASVGAFSQVGQEFGADPLGVAEAFTVAGFDLARKLSAK